jgi:hypothetical protein
MASQLPSAEAAEKLFKNSAECQGTTLVVPKLLQNEDGL